jgi:ABC-type nickel/cobalt efflux system permease component RcnA
MNATTPAVLTAAAGVGVGHAILPDHWVPLAVLGRTSRYPLRRVARLSGVAGLAHVLVSIILGAAIIIVGLQFRSSVQHAQDVIVGVVLMGTGLAFLLLEWTGRGHNHAHDHATHHDHDRDGDQAHPDRGHAGDGHDPARHDHDYPRDNQDTDAPGVDRFEVPGRGRVRGLAAVMVPFGAAASPDLTILPVFLVATTAGTATAVSSLVVFAVVTIATIIGLTLVATFGGYQLRAPWLERWGNAFTAVVLLTIGALVFVGVI